MFTRCKIWNVNYYFYGLHRVTKLRMTCIYNSISCQMHEITFEGCRSQTVKEFMPSKLQPVSPLVWFLVQFFSPLATPPTGRLSGSCTCCSILKIGHFCVMSTSWIQRIPVCLRSLDALEMHTNFKLFGALPPTLGWMG